MDDTYYIEAIVTGFFKCDHPDCSSMHNVAYFRPTEAPKELVHLQLEEFNFGRLLVRLHPSAKCFCERHIPKEFEKEYKLVCFKKRAKGKEN